MRRLIIGSVTAQLTPDEIKITPDDRQEQVKTMAYSGGVWNPSAAVVDGGYYESGEVMSVSGVKFKQSDWATIYGYWTGRTAVSVTDLNGTVKTGCRIVLRGWSQSKRFDTVIADLEVWRI